MKPTLLLVVILLCIINKANAACEVNVDKVQTLYINGMFTDAYAANSNRSLIESFIRNNLPFLKTPLTTSITKMNLY